MRRALAALALAATLASCGGPTGLHDPAKLEEAIVTQIPVPSVDARADCADLGGGTFTCTYVADGYVYQLHAAVSVDGQQAEITGDDFGTQEVYAR